ncbi:hypothetical protein [Novosphingopyxis iocasae]|uniref:hypothetical protein n=1 Tax=Novosphingopyxis iocasae TaxID=2762729 RepID=UPI00165193B9|nr:hypothetical protein [Novosphingopyxis iocasae]
MWPDNHQRRRPITKTRILAAALLASSAIAAPALAQDQAEQMDHSKMDHSQMDHGDMSAEAGADVQAGTDAELMSGDGAAQAGVTAEADAAVAVDDAGVPVEMRNAAIEGFTKAQAAQASGDFAGAVAALQPHLDTIRKMAASGDAQSQGFLADALTTVAVSKAQTGDMSNVGALLEEAVPARRAIFEMNPNDVNARLALIGALNNTGNIILQGGDKPAAGPYFKEAAEVAKAGYDANPANGQLGNAYLTAAIGMNNVTADPEWYAKVKSIATALNTAGTLDPSLAPVVQPLIGG